MGEPSGWQLSGHAPEAYERYIVSAAMGAWARDLVETATLRPGERVLDVACGTGVVARSAAPVVGQTGQVVGVDVNDGMLAMALPVPDAAFEAVLCQQGLQYFPQRVVVLQEMRRVLVPGGRLALSVWRPLERQPFFVPFVATLEAHLGAAVAALLRAGLALGDADELRTLLDGSGVPYLPRADRRQVDARALAGGVSARISGHASPRWNRRAIAAAGGSRAGPRCSTRIRQPVLRAYVGTETGPAVPLECHELVKQWHARRPAELVVPQATGGTLQ